MVFTIFNSVLDVICLIIGQRLVDDIGIEPMTFAM